MKARPVDQLGENENEQPGKKGGEGVERATGMKRARSGAKWSEVENGEAEKACY